MNKIGLIESFLNLIAEIAKNNIGIDSNLVYSNLVNINTKKEDISYYFKEWQTCFERMSNINISIDKYFSTFSSFGFNNENYTKVKIYIPLDKEHIFKGVKELLMFMSQNNIPHSTKISNSTRIDDVMVTVDDLFSAEKIRKFASENDYIKDGLLNPNPFQFTDKYVTFAWDGYLSFNVIVSEYISDYINELKKKDRLDYASYADFYDYLKRKYTDIFEKGIGINEFASSRNFVDLPSELLNYKEVTELLISALNPHSTLKDFCTIYKSLGNKEKIEEDKNRIKELITKENTHIEVTNEQKETFDYAYIEISRNNGEEYAVECFKTFAREGDYRVFSRHNNVREMLQTSKITPFVMREIIYEEMKSALINASLETIEKYDTIQLGRALFGIRNNDYSSFTNENNARRNLRLMVSSEEIEGLLETYLINDGYSPVSSDDNFWVFIELMDKKTKEKSK